MDKDIGLVILGAIVGFISAIAIELIKNWLEKKRLKKEQEENLALSKEKNVREFLSAESSENRGLAWLKLVKTPKPTLNLRMSNSRSEWDVTRPKNSQSTIHLSQKDKERNIKARNQKLATIRKYMLSDLQIIGREETCEICVADEAISRTHALIRCEHGEYIIYDLGSASETYVNSTEVSETGTVLKNLDKIILGNSAFIFETLKPNASMKGLETEDSNHPEDLDKEETA